ncbi:MAG: hypothetical protein WAT74_14390 [Flavobacteriales bacterium]
MRWPFILMLLTALACRKPEPIERADYWVKNETALDLRIEHTPQINLAEPLLTDSVSANERIHILSVTMGSGGHAMPSNFFKSFSLLAGDSVVYAGVNNSHWQREGLVDGRHQVVLTVN